MSRPVKPTRSPHQSLLRVRAARERVKLVAERRAEAKAARAARAHADKRAALAREDAFLRIVQAHEARAARPVAPATAAVKARIDETFDTAF